MNYNFLGKHIPVARLSRCDTPHAFAYAPLAHTANKRRADRTSLHNFHAFAYALLAHTANMCTAIGIADTPCWRGYRVAIRRAWARVTTRAYLLESYCLTAFEEKK